MTRAPRVVTNSRARADYFFSMPWSTKTLSDAGATGLIAATCVALLWAALNAPRPTDRTPPPIPDDPVSVEGAAVKGSDTAPVAVVEFADYQCPACKRFETNTMPRLEAAYINTGQVLWAFRHHPIAQLHPAAVGAARAAVCAGARGKFWEMHRALFADPKNMDRDSLVRRADAIGLDGHVLGSCLEETTVVAAVQRDIDHATSLKLRGTPAFLVGQREPDGRVRVTRVIPGAAPFDDFKGAIDEALAGPGSWQTRMATVTGIGVLGRAFAFVRLRRAWKRRAAGVGDMRRGLSHPASHRAATHLEPAEPQVSGPRGSPRDGR
jgi:protein-disulfide isomerase